MERSMRCFCCLVIAVFFLVQSSGAQPSGLVEVVPSSRKQAAVWHYTFESPGAGWEGAAFDDRSWERGPGGFGSAGTTGLALGTQWTSSDIWIRREVTLPSSAKALESVQLLVFHDEDIEIYFDGVLAARQQGFNKGYEPIDILPAARKVMKPGARIVIAAHCHQTIGGQGIDLGLAKVPPGQSNEADIASRKERYRNFAMSHQGDAKLGGALFADEQKLACVRCHTMDGKGDKAGPDLSTIGDKFSRRELIDAVLSPSAAIAIGYTTSVITTKADEVFVGIVKDTAEGQIGLMGADGKLVHIRLGDIRKQQTSNISLMPEGLQEGLSFQEFTNLIDHLASLKLPASAQVERQGMPAAIPEMGTPVAFVPMHSEAHRFAHPDWVGQIPGVAGAFLVCEHETGKVWRLDPSAGKESKELFGDFAGEIRRGGATGLLGLAFHPKFRENRKYYIQHERAVDGQLFAFVSEKTAGADLRHDSGQPSRAIIGLRCATDVHAGGGIEFGPDGFLYIGMGDTGPQGDPQGHAQDFHLPLGKILRIDVDHADEGRAYGVPKDNPFISAPDARPEIFALGFREPWRFSFDSATGDLWVGDVGQDRVEEVDLVRRGENYGWNIFEGFELFSNRYRRPAETYTPPVFAYSRAFGNSITGGYVYRGHRAPSWNGVYICADYASKRVWGISHRDRTMTSIHQIAVSPEAIASFGVDEAGEIYAVGYAGTVYRIDLGAVEFPGAPKQ